MLSVAVKSLESNLKTILKTYSEPAAYEAYMTQYKDNINTEAEKRFSSEENSISNKDIRKSMEDNAEAFSKKFADEFSEGLSGPLAKAIYDFVKEIGITITINPSTVASAPMGGPVSGIINPADVKIS